MFDISIERVPPEDVVKRALWPSMELMSFFVPDVPVMVRVEATGMLTDSAT